MFVAGRVSEPLNVLGHKPLGSPLFDRRFPWVLGNNFFHEGKEAIAPKEILGTLEGGDVHCRNFIAAVTKEGLRTYPESYMSLYSPVFGDTKQSIWNSIG